MSLAIHWHFNFKFMIDLMTTRRMNKMIPSTKNKRTRKVETNRSDLESMPFWLLLLRFRSHSRFCPGKPKRLNRTQFYTTLLLGWVLNSWSRSFIPANFARLFWWFSFFMFFESRQCEWTLGNQQEACLSKSIKLRALWFHCLTTCEGIISA